ncbi:tRNA adenosine(34) deaminase TadA [Vespertiliibacter pulmonis]|uniref:tRNA-specific adenosine deaminase n=1 Tax=Vespertiliibacter pulmonis TaxID=1443036 RepID=A0A3N4VXK5_9PAST|nr:tRNA adenosine(34) deaminase TadA [Vespertiliibacter pulmonis]QLB20131.1 tRNA adenosine(34) deaminase TadA [Vespertiliibacter pulmonis]RPE86103.1 tRNA(adenine34) deaminase [Vespertiliibacter pulmonis]
MFIQSNQDYCDLTFSEQDRYFMTYALKLADNAEMEGEIPVGAVLVSSQGEIIGEGWNRSIMLSDPTAHAEIQAIRMAGNKLNNYRLLDTTLYVTLEPCTMCAGAILHSRIGRLVFGAKDYKTGAVGSRFHFFEDYKMNHLLQVRGGVMARDCSEKISQFFQKRRAEQKRLKALQAVILD